MVHRKLLESITHSAVLLKIARWQPREPFRRESSACRRVTRTMIFTQMKLVCHGAGQASWELADCFAVTDRVLQKKQ